MSTDAAKADQIAYRLYTKLYLLLHDARTTAADGASGAKGQPKTDRWFNLETPDPSIDFGRVFADPSLRVLKSVSSATVAPIFVAQILLAVPDLGNNQVLVYNSPHHGRLRVDPTPKNVLLEEWAIEFTPTPVYRRNSLSDDVPPAMTYKHGIAVFRSIYALLRLMPAWKLYKRLRRRNAYPALEIKLRITTEEGVSEPGVLGFDTPFAPSSPSDRRRPSSPPSTSTTTHSFAPIPHAAGTLAIRTTYLTHPNFAVDDLESLLSDRFLAEGPDFTPTLNKNLQRESLQAFPRASSAIGRSTSISGTGYGAGGTPSSLPFRTGLPGSPPSATSIADRFVLPSQPHTRTSSFSGTGSPRQLAVGSGTGIGTVPLPGQGVAGSPGAVSIVSHASHASSTGSGSREGMAVGAAARIRRESTGTGRGELSSSPAASSPLSMRRPSLVNPFKSGTVSSGSPSTSLRNASPLSPAVATGTGPSTSFRSPIATAFQSQSPIQVQASTSASRVPPSPSGIRAGASASPLTQQEFAPSSLGQRSSVSNTSGEGESTTATGKTKRYSSPFAHRYNQQQQQQSFSQAGTGAGAGTGAEGGEAGSAPAQPQSASYMSTNTEDDDISGFMRDNEAAARRPLGGHRRQESPLSGRGNVGPSTNHDRDATQQGAQGGHMLMRKEEVDERLKAMSEAFNASLEGLGGGRRRGKEKERREETSSESSAAPSPSRADNTVARGRGLTMGVPGHRLPLPRRDSGGSGSGQASMRSGVSIGSQEVIGKMDLSEGQRKP
ncbi:hypothetical protein PUNSTDRAFT_122707 [Punctularia strigosozonata HHB-11173 SS5]|uniref:Autophagy-related protein 13 n=1 Tax=Punctularia strigosozonata (strain HHB-11173) TaxID=741275 RepID=R7S2N6_PUNST|nr:uncharacterized protein PUNSTDRAFT_122707 [Punctularia strigosozonata HHB-11173 SS5]EIN04650.1 hypothetical protein PUNSTDRAFT_122707 [Punctularia strigosozonata HHB-11173 SS5]